MENIENASNENTETTATETEAKEAQEKRQKAHEIFVAGLMAHAQALGLSYEEKAGYHKFLNPASKQKLYVGKSAKEVTDIQTTLSREVLGMEITTKLDRPNGRIECQVIPTEENVRFALELLADGGKTGDLRAPKRQPKAAPAVEESAPASASK